MPFASVTYPNLTGATATFAVPFPFLDRSHVHFYLVPSGQQLNTATQEVVSGVTWLSDSSVSIAPAPTGAALVIKRQTPEATSLVQLASKATLSSTQSVLANTQLLYLIQEATDVSADLTARAIQVPVGETASATEPLGTRAGRVGFWSSVGQLASISYSALASALAPSIQAVLGPLYKGDPGGNVMAIGLFVAAASLSIPLGTDVVQVSGYAAKGLPYRLVSDDTTVTPSYVTANPRTSFISANGRGFRLDLSQPLFIEMAGGGADRPITDFDYKGGLYISSWAVPAGVTDNLPAYYAIASLLLQTRPLNGGIALQEGGPRTPVRFANTNSAYCYHMGGPLIPFCSVALIGYGAGGDTYAGVGTMLAFPPNTAGIILNHYATQPAGRAKIGTGGSLIQGIRFSGGGGTDRTAHGVWWRTQVEVADCIFEHFSGNGRHSVASVSSDPNGPLFGLTSGSLFRRVTCINNGNWNGYISGSDCSSQTFIDVHDKGSRLGGNFDAGYFENTYIGYECNEYGNGIAGSCYLAGRNYQLNSPVPGIGSSTQPGTNDTVWEDRGPASGPSTYFPAYNAANTYELSVPTFASSIGTVYRGYTENYGYLVSVGGELRGTMNTGRYASGKASLDSDGGADLFNKHSLFRGDVLPSDPLYASAGGYVDVFTGGNPMNRQTFRGWRTALDGSGYSEAMLAGAIIREGIGIPGSGNPGTSAWLSLKTTAKLGNPTAQPGYRVHYREALGNPNENPEDARKRATWATPQPGTYTDSAGNTQNRIRGEVDFNSSVALGGYFARVSMGDGTMQPVGIVGGMQIANLSSVTTVSQLVSAILASGLGRSGA